MKRKKILFKIGILLLSLLLLPGLVGCGTSLKADPESFTFEGVSWQVSSIEFQNEFGCPSGAGTYRNIKPNSTSDTLLVIEFGTVRDFGFTPPKSLLNSLSKVVLRDTLQKPLCYTAAKPITEKTFGFTATYVFSVPKGATSIEILLPDNQIIKITK